MKKVIFLFAFFVPLFLFGQSEFSPQDYMDFRESNKSLNADELLEHYPAQTKYYSSRKYEPDLSNIPWFDTLDMLYKFTDDEKSLLRQNYFMVSERLSFMTWLGSYTQLYSQDLPMFLSTDFVLFTLHQSYDEILKNIEFKLLEPNLIQLLESMQNSFSTVYDKYSSNPKLLPSLEDVDLYLAVARSLLLDETIVPIKMDTALGYNVVMDAVKEEKMKEMPLFTRDDLNRKLDFSQFKPRGHYTDEFYTPDGMKTLENYFRTMMWLGRIDFLMTAPPENPWEEPWRHEDVLRMNLSALILNEVLHTCGKKQLLDLHEEIISFMVGPDDNLNPNELEDIYSNDLSEITDLFDNDIYNDFEESLNSSDDYGQKIMSNFFFVDPDTTDPGTLPISFKLLGQKFLIDSYIFSELVFDRIEYNGEKQYRMMPDPLDILSVFGNENAMALMKNEMETYHYAYKVSELKYLVDAYDEEFWTQSLYNNWLSALMKLNPPASSSKLPYFMQTSAWHHEKINTQLTSWAQLRHDNILYGKQSYTGGTGCSFPYTYVEPYPDFYGHLKVFANNASLLFQDLLDGIDPDLLSQITYFYDTYADIMGKLKEISEKELSRKALNEDELIFLKTMINSYMSSGPSVSGWINDLLFPAMDTWDFDYTVADVHTQPTDPGGAVVGKVLHVGNGNINLGVFIAPGTVASSGNICYIGPVGSFHTMVKRDFYRLNDEEWKDMFWTGKMPPRPDWAYGYLANGEGDTIHTANMLKGVEYTGIDFVPAEKSDLSYLLAFPNPAEEVVHFRFILNETAMVEAELVDIFGRKIRNVYSGSLPAAEHDIPVSLVNEIPGVYFLQMKVNGEPYVQRFMKLR